MPIASEVRLDVLMKGQTAIDAILRETRAALKDLGGEISKTDDKAKSVGDTQAGVWKQLQEQIFGVTGRVTDLNSALEMGGRALEFGKQFLNFMRESEVRGAALGQFSKNFDGIADAMGRLKEASGGAIPVAQLTTAANKAAMLGVSFDQLEMAMQSANHIAITTGKSFETSLDAIIETAAGTVISADRYNEFTGATLDLKKATEEYASAHGTLAKNLDLSQQRAAINAATFADLATRQEDATAKAGGWSRLTADVSDAWATMGGAIADTTGDIYDSVMGFEDHADAIDRDQGSLLALGYVFEMIAPKLRAQTEYLRDMVALQRQWGDTLAAIRKAHAKQSEASPFDVLKTQEEALFDFYVSEEKKRSNFKAKADSEAEKTAKEMLQIQERFQREMESLIKRSVERERSLWDAELDLEESRLRETDDLGRARLDRERALQDAYIQLSDERITAEEYAIRTSLAENEYYLTERDIQIERQREQDDRARESLANTIAGLQAMDSQLGQVQGSLAKGLRATSRIYQGLVTHIGGIVRGEAGAISSLGAITASVIDNQQAAAAVMTIAALAEGFYAMSRHDYEAATAAFASSALFAAVAGGAGAPSGGGGASTGGGGGGLPASQSGFGQSVGQTTGGGGTIIVQGFVGSPQQLATTLAGEQDRSRRSNLVRSAGV